MRRDRTDGTLGNADYYPETRSAALRVGTMPPPSRPPHAAANLRAAVGMIAGLLLVWVVIVTG